MMPFFVIPCGKAEGEFKPLPKKNLEIIASSALAFFPRSGK
jgi:hypothetical protein